MLLTGTTRFLGMLIGLIVIIGLVSFTVRSCQSAKTAKKQSEVSQGQAGAAIDSGSEAMNTVSNVTGNALATDADVARGQGEVRAAPEADKGNAAVNAACRFKANRNKPQCLAITGAAK